MSLAYVMDLRRRRYVQTTAVGSKMPSPKSPTPEYLKTPPGYSPPPNHPLPQFRHNPLHDLESMFWIVAYFLFKTGGKGAEAEAIARQQNTTRELFYDDLQRCFCIQDNTTFIRNLGALHPSIQPAGLSLDAWRSELGSTFYSAEKDCSHITRAVAAGLHDSLASTLHCMAHLVELSSITPASKVQKRALQDVGTHSDTEADQGGPAKRRRSE